MVRNDQIYYMYYPRIQAVCQAPFRVLSPLPALRRQKKQTMYLAIMIGICYNAYRQERIIISPEKRKSPDARPGIFYSV